MATNNACDYSPTQYNVQTGGSNGTLNNVSPSATSGIPVISQGSSSQPVFGTALVAGGGTAATSFNTNGVVISNTSSTGALAALSLIDGQIVIGSSAGAPAAATLTAGSGVTITNGHNTITIAVTAGSTVVETLTGNTGGAISPSSGNINTVGTGSITIVGSGSTLTTQLTGLTNHNVLIGAGSATITNVAPSATSGIPLVSNGSSSDPSFTTAVVAGGGTGSTSFTAYGPVVAASTSTGALTSVTPSATSGVPLISNGSSSNPSFGTAVVAGGGTGDTSFTTYAPICGGTSTTGALQSASTGQSTSGYIFTSTGSSSLPTWQAAPASGITTLEADNSGTATGSTVTISGGSTGLTTTASSATVDLTGTLGIANGGTDATSFTQSNGIVTYNGTSLVNYAGPQLSSGGIYTNTSQPLFQAYNSTSPTNLTGDNTVYNFILNTALVNRGTNYSTSTGIFTAPVTGMYSFTFTIAMTGLLVGHTSSTGGFGGTEQYFNFQLNPFTDSTSGNNFFTFSQNIYLAATATVQPYFLVSGGAKVVGFIGTQQYTTFSGCLLA